MKINQSKSKIKSLSVSSVAVCDPAPGSIHSPLELFTLQKNRTQVQIKSVDGWIFDLIYSVNRRETYYAQILKTDIPGKIESLKREGFKEGRMLSNVKVKKGFNTVKRKLTKVSISC